MSRLSTLVIRFALCALFAWFGVQQLLHPEAWVSFLPEWLGYLPIPAEMIVQWNGWFEVVAVALFAVGYMTRVVAFVLGAHLMAIAVTVGGAIGVRDAALAAATLAFVVSRPDDWTFDAREARKKASSAPIMR